MSTRERSKQVRKSQAVQQARARERRKRILWIIGGVMLLAVIAVGIIVSQSPSTSAAVGAITPIATQTWPQADGKSLGPADARVVVQEFADFQCPFCRQFHTSVAPKIIEEYVETGRIRYEYRHFIVIDNNVGGTESRDSAEASECAAEQNRFWDYYDILYTNQVGEGEGAFSEARLVAFAESIGLDMDQFNSCFNSREYRNAVREDERLASSKRLGGTPSLLVNGKRIENPMDYTQVVAAIESALSEGQ